MGGKKFRTSSFNFYNGSKSFLQILSSLAVSGSLMLLDLVIKIICREESHSHEEKIQAQLAKFIKR